MAAFVSCFVLDRRFGIAQGFDSGERLAGLFEQPIVNDELAGMPLLVTFEKASFSPGVFERKSSGRILNFELREGQLVDIETESEWDLLTGAATSGQLVYVFRGPYRSGGIAPLSI